jgi:hypothetical protein
MFWNMAGGTALLGLVGYGIAFALLWRRLGGGREFPFGPSLALGLFLCLQFPALVRIFG